jgi:prepilin-type processing-associated H-X9-DG protein
LGDFDGDKSPNTPNIGEGMACIDFMGVSGPSRHIEAPNGRPYAKNQGVFVEVLSVGGRNVVAAKVRPRDVERDGLSNTFMVAESTTRSVWYDPGKGFWELSGTWASGQNTSNIELPINVGDGLLEVDPEEEIFSDHPNGAYLLFADGSVHFANEMTDIKVLAALCSRNGRDKWGENKYSVTVDDLE